MKTVLSDVDHNDHYGVNDDVVPHHQIKLGQVVIDQYLLLKGGIIVIRNKLSKVLQFCAC